MHILPDMDKRSDFHYDGSVVTPASARIYGYALLKRDSKNKKNQVRHAFFWAPGDACIATAEKYFESFGYSIKDYRMVDERKWHEIEIRQHLREIGIK